MKPRVMLAALLATAALASAGTSPASAEDTVKIGLILPMTGPFASTGRQIADAAKLYVQQNGDVAGKHVEIILRDDAGVPDTTKRLAQEMVVNDHVAALAGFGLTPLALAAAPIATRGKVPEVVMAAATSSITAASPYIVRTSQTVPQIAATVGDWAAANGMKKVVSIVSDYGPGIDCETWFKKAFEAKGGVVPEALRVPLANPDFAPFLQRAADAKPDAVFVFVPSGAGSVFIRQFTERGLDKKCQPPVDGSPAMSIGSLTAIGTPASGPSASPAARRRSIARASSNACAFIVINALNVGLKRSMRARHARVSASDVTPAAKAAWQSATVISTAKPSSSGFMPAMVHLPRKLFREGAARDVPPAIPSPARASRRSPTGRRATRRSSPCRRTSRWS